MRDVLSVFEKYKAGILRTLSANSINKVISMISSMLVTRLLTANEYGIWSYALNLYSYLLLITGFGLISGALQFGTENKGKGKAFQYFKYCTKTGLLVDFVIISLFGGTIALLQLPIDGAKPFVIVILPMLLMEYFNTIGQCVLRSQNRISEYTNVLNVNTVLIVLGTCGGALLGLHGLVVGRYIAYLLSVAYVYWLLRVDLGKIQHAENLKKAERRFLWHYSLFTGASSAMNCLIYSLDITLIAALIKNAEEVGIYRVGTLIPNALQFVPSSVIVAILPTIIYNRTDISWIRKNVRKTYMGLFIINAVIVSIIFLTSPLFIRIISGEKYIASVPVLRVLALGYLISGTFRNLSISLLAAFRRVHFGLFISIVSSVLDIGMNYLLIKTYGMIGAAYATLAVDIVTAVISFSYVLILLRRGTINENY